MLDFQTQKYLLPHIPGEGTEAWRGYKYLPRATEMESGQIDPSLYKFKVCVLPVTKPGQRGSPRTRPSSPHLELVELGRSLSPEKARLQRLSGAASRTLGSGGESERTLLASWLWSCPLCPGQ